MQSVTSGQPGFCVLLLVCGREKFKAQRMKNVLRHKMMGTRKEKAGDLKAQKVSNCFQLYHPHISVTGEVLVRVFP